MVYSWEIVKLECNPQKNNLTNVVSIVHWKRNLTETVDNITYKSSDFGVCNLYFTDPENFILDNDITNSLEFEDFIPYDELTKEKIEYWLNRQLSVKIIDDYLLKNIENQKNPPLVSLPLPWVN
jgi:hypothetical protein